MKSKCKSIDEIDQEKPASSRDWSKGAINTPLKCTKVTLFTMILYYS